MVYVREASCPGHRTHSVVAYCLHLPLVEVHVTDLRLVKIRVHATYISSSHTTMGYVVFRLLGLYHCC